MKHKTALATAASITGVLLASAAAMGANVGILRSNDDTFGQLSAADDVASDGSTLESTVVSITDLSTTATTAAAGSPVVYQVPGIADITLARSGETGVTVVGVVPVTGWTHSIHANGDGIEVKLTSATEQVEFKASVLDGQIQTTVERSALGAASAGSTSTTQSSGSGTTNTTFDDHGGDRDDSDDDDSYDDNSGSDDSGGDDDDYEGGDDDD